MEKLYMSYKEVNKKLDDLVNNDYKVHIKKEEPIGYTTYLLPIEHYTMGYGGKHIILMASYQGTDAITTTFMLKLMEELASNPEDFNFKDYKIHFIPIVNPEGYLITSQMHELLGEQHTQEFIEALREDTNNSLQYESIINSEEASNEEKAQATFLLRKDKHYQALFDNIDMQEYLKDYPELKANVFKILQKGDYPIGVCSVWESNGNGIDLSGNVPFNKLISMYQEQAEPIYAQKAYANIRTDIPGPINTPCIDLKNFSFEKENTALLNFLCDLKEKEEIVAFINYRQVMNLTDELTRKEKEALSHVDYFKNLAENFVGNKALKDNTNILESYNYINEYYRIRFGINIQVELLQLNDIKDFNTLIVEPNIKAFRNFCSNLPFIKEYSKLINTIINKYTSETKRNIDAQELYNFLDTTIKNDFSLYDKLKANDDKTINYLLGLIDENLANSTKKRSNFIDEFLRRVLMEKEIDSTKIERIISSVYIDYPDLITKIENELDMPSNDDKNLKRLCRDLENLVTEELKMDN